jgi:hypothetical protein
MPDCGGPVWGHEHRFHDVGDEFDLPPTPERLRQCSGPTLRANSRQLAIIPAALIVGQPQLRRNSWVGELEARIRAHALNDHR